MQIKAEYIELQSEEELNRLKQSFKKKLHYGKPGQKNK